MRLVDAFWQKTLRIREIRGIQGFDKLPLSDNAAERLRHDHAEIIAGTPAVEMGNSGHDFERFCSRLMGHRSLFYL
ncbi:hypothetical protein DB346_13815 [Verrucomicrobia bacterium LW23]|nr:hypothetical protein DB346_13815 [Verrucomicrobia bacterium LW23]